MILLVIDIQKEIVTEDLYAFDTFLQNVTRLISLSRNQGIEVLYIQHDDRCDTTVPDPNMDIYEDFAPVADERVIVKRFNSAFRQTELEAYLREKGESKLMVTGLMTDYCMDATIKSGFERGFEIIVPANANSTFANEYMSAEATYRYFNQMMWPRRYANCVTMEEAEQFINQASQKRVAGNLS